MLLDLPLNPLARIPPGGALRITSLTWSYKHAIKTQQTAVDRARSQDDNSLKIAHGPHKKKLRKVQRSKVISQSNNACMSGCFFSELSRTLFVWQDRIGDVPLATRACTQ